MSRPKSDTVQVNLRLPRAHIARAEALAARMAPMGAISPTTAMRAALARGLDAYDVEAGVLSDEPRWPPGPRHPEEPLSSHRSQPMNTASDTTKHANLALALAGILGVRLSTPAQTEAPEVDESGRPKCPSTNFRVPLDGDETMFGKLADGMVSQLVRDGIGGTLDDVGIRSGSPLAACGVFIRDVRASHLILTAWAQPQA